MFVMIAAGGTGGHFYPGLSVARALLSQKDKVSFIIKKGDYVRPFLDREKIPYVSISAGGFQRRLSPSNLLTLLKLGSGFFEAFKILSRDRPGVLLAMGGYLSVPPALAAKCLGIPVLLHEQNVLPGLANRFLSHLAVKVAVSFQASLFVFGNKAVLTGNPIRNEFTNLPLKDEACRKWKLDPNKKTILIFGGSLGAQRLNQFVVEALEKLSSFSEKFQFIHITGPADVAWVAQRYAKMPFQHYVDSYCHDMPSAYAACDLVIARSGASTVSELMVAQKPAVLVPYPLATGGHQTANGAVLARLGTAQVHEQKDLENGGFKNTLELLLQMPEVWSAWKENYRKLETNPAEAAGKIVGLIREITA